MTNQTNVVDAVTHHKQKVFNVRLESSNVKYAINLATSHQYVTRKVQVTTHQARPNQGNQKHNNYVQGHFTPSMMLRAVHMSQGWKIPSVYKMKVHRTYISHQEVPKLVYLMANLAYHLQEYHTRNQYLRARLRHLQRCKPNAYGSILPDVQRSTA